MRRRPWLTAGAAVVAAAVVVGIVVVVVGGGRTVTALGENVVGIIDPATGGVLGRIPVGTNPTAIAAGAGAVWAANTDDDTVARIDPATRSVTQVIDVGGAPTSVVVGGGSVWVANSTSGTVTRIDPRTGRVLQTDVVGGAPSALAFARGSLWVADTSAALVLQVDPATGTVTHRVGVGDAPSALVAGDGSLWVSNSGDGTVSQIDTARATALPPVHVGNDPRGLALDGGSLWVANNLDGTVTRIITATDAIAATTTIGSGPVALAVAAGKVWVADQDGAAITEVDPARNTVTATVSTASQPADVVAAGNHLWVAAGGQPALHRGGTFTAVVGDAKLDPAYPGALAGDGDGMLYDGLVAFRRAPGAAGDVVVPDLAVGLPAPTDDGRSYTFRLRQGVRWSTGAPVTGKDIRRGIERMVAAGLFLDLAIVGADRCTRSVCDLSAGIAVDDAAGTVTIRLSTADPEFLDNLAQTAAVPFRTPLAEADHPLPTTGPYTVARYDPKSSFVLVRNRYFHEWSHAAQPAGFPDRMVFTIEPSSTEHPDKFVNSGFDWLDVRGADLNALRSRVSDRLRVSPRLTERYLFLNTSVAPFSSLAARRAVSYAIDRAAVAADWPEPGEITCQVLPPTVPGYRPYCPYTLRPDAGGTWQAPDLATAQRLVRQSGTAGAAVTVWTNSPPARAMRHVVDAMNEIGYRATLRVFPAGSYFDVLGRHPEVQAGAVGWVAGYPSASQFTNVAECAAIRTGANFSRFCDPAIDARISSALALEARSPQQANDVWRDVDRALTDALPLVPLLVDTNAVLLSPRVRHYEGDVIGPLFDQVWLR